MKKAFTMIELIFIIVVIGILSAIALPKLMATRNDAKVVIELNNLFNCINDIGNSYTSREKEDNDTQACHSIKCAEIILGDLTDGNITVNLKTSQDGAPKYCDYVKEKAIKKKLNGKHSFSGTRLKLE